MSKFKWVTYEGAIPVPEPADYQPPKGTYGPVLMASCYSKNGYYGCAWIIKTQSDDIEQGYWTEAGSEDTGNLWKSPNVVYPTIGEAVAEAERLWRPV